MDPNKRTPMGTFDRDMQDFLMDMEMSAKKIIKKSNKKRMEETQRMRQTLAREKLGMSKDKLRTASAGLLNKTDLAEQPTMLFGYPEKPNFNDSTQLLHPSASLGTLDYGGKLARPISPIQNRPQPSVESPLPDLKESLRGKRGKSLLGVGSMSAMPSTLGGSQLQSSSKNLSGSMFKKPVINKKLAVSPLFSDSMTGLLSNDYSRNKITPVKQRPKSRGAKATKQRAKAQLSKSQQLLPGEASAPPAGGFASTFAGASQAVAQLQGAAAAAAGGGGGGAEHQGPVSWDLDDLRVKYRGEREREAAWAAYRAQKAAADRLWRDEGRVLPVAAVARHPVYAALHRWAEQENARSANRARARNKMKRFVQDVHQVWMTNLRHLKEYQLDQAAQVALARRGGGGRRDVDAILQQRSQVQSLAPAEATKDFLYPNVGPFPAEAEADGRGEDGLPVPELGPPFPAAPVLSTLVECLELDLRSEAGGPRRRRHIWVHRLAWPPGDEEEEEEEGQEDEQEADREGTKGASAAEVEPARWRIVAYDPLTGRESALVLEEAAALGALRGFLATAPARPLAGVHRRAARVPVGAGGVFKEPALVEVLVGEGPRPPAADREGWAAAAPPAAAVAVRVYPAVRAGAGARPLELRLGGDELWYRLRGGAWEAGAPPAGAAYWRSAERAAPGAEWDQAVGLLRLHRLPSAAAGGGGGGEGGGAEALAGDGGGGDQEDGRSQGAESAPTLDDAQSQATAASGLEKVVLGLGWREAAADRWGGSGAHRAELTAAARALAAFLKLEDPPAGALDAGALSLPAVTAPVPGFPRQTLRPAERGAGDSAGAGWEAAADAVLPLSLRVSGKLDRLRRVPGLCAVGQRGLWGPPRPADLASGFTQPAGVFFRDPALSSTDSVLAGLLLALEEPELSPVLLAWDPYNQLPPVAWDDKPPGVYPAIAAVPHSQRAQPVDSPLDARRAPTLLVLTEAAIGEDFAPAEGAAAAAKAGHRRAGPELDQHSFRRRRAYWLTLPDPHFANVIFGVTRRSAVGNGTGVSGRSIWHSEARSVEQLVRLRSPKDYAYVLKDYARHHGFFDPHLYHVYLEHEALREVWKGGLEAWEEKVRQLQEEKVAKAKAEALEAKIKAGQDKIAAQRLKEARMAKKLQIKEFRRQQRARGKENAARLKRQWAARLARSEVLGRRGDWEMRRDGKTGQFFYHCTDPYVPSPDQWDPPAGWEQMPEVGAPAAASSVEGYSHTLGATSVGETTLMEGMRDTQFLPTQEGSAQLDASGAPTGGPASAGGPGVTFMEGPANAIAGGGAGAAGALAPTAAAGAGGRDVEALVDELAGNRRLVEQLALKLGVPAGALDAQDPNAAEPGQREREGSDLSERAGRAGVAEVDSDEDPWSDPDDEFGEYGEGDLADLELPQDHTDNWAIHQRDQKERKGRKHRPPEGVPELDLVKRMGLRTHDAKDYEGHLGGRGWRRLPKAQIARTFHQKATQPHTSGPLEGFFVGDTANESTLVGLLDPAEVVDHEVDQATFATRADTMFVDNVVDVLSNLKEAARLRLKKEELLSEDVKLAELLGNRDSDKLTSEQVVIRSSEAEEALDLEDRLPELEHRAVLAAKNGNLEALELVLDEGAPLETADNVGNTLLILAAQQGNKRLTKFLLRRGATMNVQNVNGNTVLHYCYEYHHTELAEYLKEKGADDSLLNIEGMTCYEGLKRDTLDAL